MKGKNQTPEGPRNLGSPVIDPTSWPQNHSKTRNVLEYSTIL